MFVKVTNYDVSLPTSIDRLKSRSIKLPYKKIENSKERVLLIFDNAHRSDITKNTLASGIIGDFIRMVDAKCKANTGNSIFTQSVFTINYSYAYEDQGSVETADTEKDDNSGDIEKIIEKINTQRVLKFIASIKPTKIVALGRKSFLFLRQFYTDNYLQQVAWASMLGVPKPVDINGHVCKLIAMLNPNIICQYTTSREPYLIGYFCRSWENVVIGKLRFDANIRPDSVKVVFVDTIQKFDKLLALLYSQKEVAIDTETTSLFRVANTMLTIQFAFDKKKAFFLPYKHYDTPFSAKELTYIKEKLSEYFLTNQNTLHLYCNANFDIPIIRKEFELPIYQNTIWDVQAGEYCFHPDSYVSTSEGKIKISELVKLEKPPKVWSMNTTTKEIELKAIIGTSTHKTNKRMVLIEYEGGAISVTEDHKIWSNTRMCYIEAKDIQVNEDLVVQK